MTTLNLAINTLIEEARKGVFEDKIKSCWLSNPGKLFKTTLISPILTYCNKIWGIFSNFKELKILKKLSYKTLDFHKGIKEMDSSLSKVLHFELLSTAW